MQENAQYTLVSHKIDPISIMGMIWKFNGWDEQREQREQRGRGVEVKGEN